ncbi:unnamed protein product [Bursaphelenchus xylophilus]|uniref:(pine wood nematode) hypothetical protein n=1 Tax=Bursaphelenchus xylophilus TaxID=6326 RepID=A0A1I7SWV8_BURXY|nr:unnamed protein product [Bursaphelenchus xylophilus]CAG9099988.1 unnamed protein product [Bursaphelenchus xylophilus]
MTRRIVLVATFVFFYGFVTSEPLYEYEIGLLQKTLDKNSQDNVVISGFSILNGLELVYRDAQGQTRQEFLDLIGKGSSSTLVSQKTRALQQLDGRNLTLKLANKAYISAKITIKKEHTRDSRDDLIEQLNFEDSKRSTDLINGFVNFTTNGLIDKIVTQDDVNSNTNLVMVNALYFTGEFASKFNKNKTKNLVFYPKAGVDKEVPTMYKKAPFPYKSTAEADVVHVLYKGNARLVLVVPKEKFGLDKLVKELDSEKLKGYLNGLESRGIELFLPKFSISFEDDVREQLQSLGLKKGFSPEADFGGLTDQKVPIDKVNHKVVFKTDEDGTVAGASTAVVSSRSFSPVVNADHPFLFFVVADDEIIFSGTLRDIE